MTIAVFDINRGKVAELELDGSIFDVELREDLISEVVRMQSAKRRAGTASTKGRSDVSGGGRKPWKQKGTGRARQGSTRAPQWRGGGVFGGPKPRDYAYKLNKKFIKKALCSLLSYRVRENKFLVIDSIPMQEEKTLKMANILHTFELKKGLIVDDGNEGMKRVMRNLADYKYLDVKGINVFDCLKFDTVLITKKAVESLTARLLRVS